MPIFNPKLILNVNRRVIPIPDEVEETQLMVDTFRDFANRLRVEQSLGTFAERLTWALKCKGQTQTWLAGQLDISDQAISKWKASEQIGREHLFRVCQLLDCSAHWLMNGLGPGPIATRVEQPEAPYLLRIPVVGTAQLGDNGFWAEFETPPGHGDGYIKLGIIYITT